jgi:hypothetical protein
VLVALIDAMTPQEVINSLKALKRRGAFDNAEVKALIDEKIRAAAEDKRVSTFKAKRAIAAADLDAETERTLTEVTDQRVAAKVEIKAPMALFVDKSGSMTEAIEVAKQLAALVGAVVTADFRVYAFDTAAFEITAGPARGERPALSDWEQAFKFIKADGSTSIGAPLAKMTKDGVYVEQVVLVTDEGETSNPRFVDAYAEYQGRLGAAPRVIIVQVGSHSPHFSAGLTARGIEVMRYEFRGDYYSLPNVLPRLAIPSRAELVDQIMARELPRRPVSVGV